MFNGGKEVSFQHYICSATLQEQSSTDTDVRKGFEKGSSPGGKSSGGSESPKLGRRRFGSTADEIDVTKLNGMVVIDLLLCFILILFPGLAFWL